MKTVIVAITIVAIVLMICVTYLIYTFIDNTDLRSIWQTEKYLKQILKNQEEQAEMNEYKKAFRVACELLNGDIVHGTHCLGPDNTIYQTAMEKDGFCNSRSYEKYILENLETLSK